MELFEKTYNSSGYRLKCLEIYNWGTFHKKIWKVNADGKNSLLTGGNGAGKTTIADAVLTLLVPYKSRQYNQSSGVTKKNDRTEKDYVLGAYTSKEDEERKVEKAEYLRKEGEDYSVLLGVFDNDETGKSVTLAQVRWFSNGSMTRHYIVASKQLSIETHFSGIDPRGKWKKELSKEGVAEFYDTFHQYTQQFSTLFGLKSSRALSLFSQIVGLKEIDDLNEFIRTHMLESEDIEKDFRELSTNYEHLSRAHGTIEKAKDQLELLEPIVTLGNEYRADCRKLADIEMLEAVSRPCMAGRVVAILEDATREEENHLRKISEQIENLDAELTSIRAGLTDYEVSKRKNEESLRLEAIDTEVKELQKKKERRLKNLEAYNKLTNNLDLSSNPDEDLFQETYSTLGDRDKEVSKRIDRLDEKRIRLLMKKDDLDRELSGDEKELKSLKTRTSNIPERNLEIRKGIASHLAVNEEDVPFIGELLRVKEGEHEWESAIENVLNNFGLCLLVADEYYARVNEYVNSSNLKGRLVYFRVSARDNMEPVLGEAGDIHPDSLVKKLEIKKENRFQHWLSKNLKNRFDFICTDDVSNFHEYPMALSKEGLVKNRNRHEKDDRKKSKNRNSYILGWDNREKVRYYKKRLDNTLKKIDTNVEDEKKIRANIGRSKSEREYIAGLLKFEKYSEIDTESVVKSIDNLAGQRNDILSSSDFLKEIDTQVEKLRKEEDAARAQRDEAVGNRKSIEDRLESYQEHISHNSFVIDAFKNQHPDTDIDEWYESLLPYIDEASKSIGSELSTDNFSEFTGRISTSLSRKRKQVNGLRESRKDTLVNRMNDFKTPQEAVRLKHPSWMSDAAELYPSPDHLDGFIEFYERITREDLPRYRERFRVFLNDNVLDDIISFRENLMNRIRKIEKTVNEINYSLKNIEFRNTPIRTFLKINCRKERTPDLKRFENLMKTAIPESGALTNFDDKSLEENFKGIKAFIDELKENDRWRMVVTDARNWRYFSAEEVSFENGETVRFYSKSGKLSGGEKAKLAYTILASAIAHQFGINQDEEADSFRFIVVDEAFSKVDTKNSKYALDLFKKLRLQLVMITPLSSVNTVESYIDSVHYVEMKANRHSAVHKLSIKELNRLGSEYKAAEVVSA